VVFIVNLLGADYASKMERITGVRRMQLLAAEVKRSGRRIALVPTMGALHEGQVALMRRAREQGAAVVVSLYVNPTQFGPREDFKQYPRQQEADLQLCDRERVDALFAPSDEEMYPGGLWMAEDGSTVQLAVPSPIRGSQYSTFVDELVLGRRLEGERRRGFFRGVCTVVAKLFHIVQPDVAVFGLKDYQQFKVIQRLVRDLCWPVEIVGVPTVREADGLACSSRNQYLSPSERAQATVLSKALHVAQNLFNDGEANVHRLEAAMMRAIELAPATRTDYAEIADAETLEPVSEVKRGNVALVAAYVGRTRLIDNLIL